MANEVWCVVPAHRLASHGLRPTTAGSLPLAIWLRHSPAMRWASSSVIAPKVPMMRRVDAAPGEKCAYKKKKRDLSSLAAPCWVGILGIADADAETGESGVEHSTR